MGWSGVTCIPSWVVLVSPDCASYSPSSPVNATVMASTSSVGVVGDGDEVTVCWDARDARVVPE
jgi:hypothetical protein